MIENPPLWITRPLSPSDIAAILQGECSSGAYMPAVVYAQARKTMAEHGNDVVTYLDEGGWDEGFTLNPSNDSWGMLCVRVLSAAVELWCSCHESLADWNNETPLWSVT